METNTRYILCIIVLSFSVFILHSQNFIWAQKNYQKSGDIGYSVSTDNLGNSYVAGSASGTVAFGVDTLILGSYGMFTAKYDQNGNALWGRAPAGNAFWPLTYKWSISSFITGGAIVTGTFRSGNEIFGTDTLVNKGDDDIFLVRYDANGNVLWAKSFGGNYTEDGLGVTTDSHGYIYLTGYFGSATINFGSYTLYNHGPNYDIYVVKFDSSGNALWANSSGGSLWDVGSSIATDANGNVYVTGYFQSSSITFGSQTLINDSANTYDIFVTKYSGSGVPVWAKSFGGKDNDYGLGITAASGNVSITGYFSSSQISFGSNNFNNRGSTDIFVVSLDTSNGNILWARQEGGAGLDEGKDICSDITGNITITGLYSSPNMVIGIDSLINRGQYDAFVIRYNPIGNVVWAKSIGNTGNEYGQGICENNLGNTLITGCFTSDTVSFFPYILTDPNSYDQFFISELGSLFTDFSSQKNEEKNIIIYPNPSKGRIYFESNIEKSENIEFQIYNELGQLVFLDVLHHIAGTRGTHQIDLSSLANGFYIIKVFNEANLLLGQEKIVIEK